MEGPRAGGMFCALNHTMPKNPRLSMPLERMTTEQMLACVDPFLASRPEEIGVLARATIRECKTARTVLLREGERAEGLSIVLRGRVNLVRGGDRGGEIILICLGPGEIFGEGCLLEDMGASTAAVVAVASDVAKVPSAALGAHIAQNPSTLIRLMRLMSERLSRVESVASGLALCDVEERLRRTLIQLARGHGRGGTHAEGWILAPAPTQSELARMVGSCRETVSRTLSAMTRDGLLRSSGRRMLLTETLVNGAQ